MRMQRDLNRRTAARRCQKNVASESMSGQARPVASRLLARLRRDSEGQALLEFALVAPILVMLMIGIFVYSMVMYQKISLQTAADQGVQALALNQNVSSPIDACTAATNAIQAATPLNSSLIDIKFYNGPALTGTAISAGGSCNTIQSGTQLSVYLTYPCNLLYFQHGQCQIHAAQSEQVP